MPRIMSRGAQQMRQSPNQKTGTSDSEKVVTFSFALLLLLIIEDYVGLGRYLPLVDILHLPLLLILILTIRTAVNHGISEYFDSRQVKLLLFYVFLTALAILHGLISAYAVTIFKQQVVYLLFIFISIFLIDSRRRIDLLTSVVVVAHVFLVAVNFEKLGSERSGFFSAGWFMGDGNDFAWSLNIAIPFVLYWFMRSKGILVRSITLAFFVVMLVGVVGTGSRGAFVALASILIYLAVVVNKRKTTGILVLAVIAAIGLAVAPPNYGSRIQTITNYEEDSSAMGRIHAWKAAVRMAADHPILGVGAGSFSSAYGRDYRREGDPVRWISTHSIYFKILSEYSFLGLAVLLAICFSNLSMNRRSWLAIRGSPGLFSLDERWPRILNMSMIGFMVGGLFLTGVNYLHIFILTALTIATSRIVRREESQRSLADDQQSNDQPVGKPVRRAS